MTKRQRINAEWMASVRRHVDRIPQNRRPLAVFDALERWFETPEFRGCPFISTAAEVHDPTHAVHRAAWSFKKGLRDYFAELLGAAGHTSPEHLADQLLLLADGAMVRAAMEEDSAPARSAKAAAAVLLSTP